MKNYMTPTEVETENINGHNTKARLTFVRHSQKVSGQVFVEGTTELSLSNLSDNGIVRAIEFGKLLKGRVISRAYGTKSARTVETLKAAFESCDIVVPIQQPETGKDKLFIFPESSESEDISLEYKKILEQHKTQYLETHYPQKSFNSLTSDQQEEVAENSEEPAIEWYLKKCDTKTRIDPETPTTREHAAAIAYKIYTLIKWTDLMPNGESVDVISCGHKTSTEAFLYYCVILPNRDKPGLDSLNDIGGSMKILDSWDLQIENDADGKKKIGFFIQRNTGERKEYRLDPTLIEQLAREHMQQNQLTSFVPWDHFKS